MTRRPRRLILPLLVALPVLILPAAASGAVKCVNQSGGDCDPTLTYTSIQGAVGDANNGDTIKIAAGTYFESVDAGTKTLTFLGAGPTTEIAPGSTAAGEPALSVPRGATVRSLRLVGGEREDIGGAGAAGIRFVSTGDFSLALDRVTVVGGDGPGGGGSGGPGVDVQNGDTPANSTRLTIRSSALSGGSSTFGGSGIRSSAAGGTVEITDTRAVGAAGVDHGNGLDIRNGATASVARSSFEGRAGVSLNNSSLIAVRTLMTGDNGDEDFATGLGVTTSGMASGQDKPAAATIVDSVVSVSPTDPAGTPYAAATVDPVSAATSLTARGSTFFARGASQAGLSVIRHPTYPPATVNLRNSIVRSVAGGPESADLFSAAGTITAAFSSFTTTRIGDEGGTVPAPGSAGNVAGDPKLAADLSLQPTSPLIERGDPSIVSAGELDFAGAARSLDANGDCLPRPDIGAFERPATSPPLCFQAVRIGSARVSNKRFAPVKRGGKVAAKKKKKKRKPKRGTRFRYTLSEAAAVRIVIERVTKGRRIRLKGKRVCAKPTRKRRKRKKCNRYKRVTTLTASQGAGAQSIPFTGRVKGRALQAGKYRARITATDRQGARSAERRISLSVVKP